MDPLRAYLLFGLIAHKAVWEVLKRGRATSGPAVHKPATPMAQLVKGVKVAILLGIVVQCALPAVFPIADDASALRFAGVIAFTAGLLIAILGRLQLGNNWLDIESANVLKGQHVVSNGIYGFIRHPIY